MITQAYDLVFQLSERFVDQVAKASFYGNLYPHYFDYTDQAFTDAGGDARYLFIGAPSAHSESGDSGFLRVVFPFRLSRPDNVSKMIEGTFHANVGIEMIPATGAPEKIQLDFGAMSIEGITSGVLEEVAEELSQVDDVGRVSLIFLLGANLLDENGNIRFDGFIREKLVTFFDEEVGKISITPALREINNFGLNVQAADYKVVDQPGNQEDALSLMLDFEGSSFQGNKGALGALLSSSQHDFAFGASERLLKMLFDREVASGGIPNRIDGVHSHTVHLSNFQAQILEGKVRLSVHAKTKVKVDYLFFTDTHDVSADARVDVSVRIDENHRPVVETLELRASNVQMSGVLGAILELFIDIFSGGGASLGANFNVPIENLLGNLMGTNGSLETTWDLPEEFPYSLHVQASEIALFPGEAILRGNADLRNQAGEAQDFPSMSEYPPAPYAYLGIIGEVEKETTVLNEVNETFAKPPRIFKIYIPCPGDGEVPELYREVPQLKQLIDAGTCGHVDITIAYDHPWTRRIRSVRNTYTGKFNMHVVFLGPGTRQYRWYLSDNLDAVAPTPAEQIAQTKEVEFVISDPGTGDADFHKELVAEVVDVFGIQLRASHTFWGRYREDVKDEFPDPRESGTYEIELLLEQVQKLSTALSKKVAAEHIPQLKEFRDLPWTVLRSNEPLIRNMKPMLTRSLIRTLLAQKDQRPVSEMSGSFSNITLTGGGLTIQENYMLAGPQDSKIWSEPVHKP